MVPVVAGISFEIIQWAGRSDSKIADFFSKPGLAMQKLTTKEPTADMAEVAIKAVEAVFDWRAYLKDEFDLEIPYPSDEETVAEKQEKRPGRKETMETLTGLLKKGQEILVQAGIEEAGLDARLLLEYITGKSRAY